MMITVDPAKSDCPITVVVPILGEQVLPLPPGISTSADTELELKASGDFIQALVEIEEGVKCSPGAASYTPNTATLDLDDLPFEPFEIEVEGTPLTCAYALDDVAFTIEFTSKTACAGTSELVGVLECAGGVGPATITGGNDNCKLVLDIVGTKCSPDCTVDCPDV